MAVLDVGQPVVVLPNTFESKIEAVLVAEVSDGKSSLSSVKKVNQVMKPRNGIQENTIRAQFLTGEGWKQMKIGWLVGGEG